MKEKTIAETVAVFHRPWLTLEDAAFYLNMSRTTFQRKVQKFLTPRFPGGRPQYKREELDQYAESKRLPEFEG